jgi:hypothetical protein
MEVAFSSETSVDLQRLYGIMSKKIESTLAYTLFNCSERNKKYLKSLDFFFVLPLESKNFARTFSYTINRDCVT